MWRCISARPRSGLCCGRNDRGGHGPAPALRGGIARAGRRAGFVLAGFANGKTGSARGIFRAGSEHLVGEFQPSNAHFKRELERGGSRGAYHVDVGDWTDAVRVGGDCCARHPRQCQVSWCAGILFLFGGVIPYALWNNALRHWRTSQVVLFNNLIPFSTMAWAWFFLNEPFTSTFWAAMILIVAGVVLGQANWSKIFEMPEGF